MPLLRLECHQCSRTSGRMAMAPNSKAKGRAAKAWTSSGLPPSAARASAGRSSATEMAPRRRGRQNRNQVISQPSRENREIVYVRQIGDARFAARIVEARAVQPPPSPEAWHADMEQIGG